MPHDIMAKTARFETEAIGLQARSSVSRSWIAVTILQIRALWKVEASRLLREHANEGGIKVVTTKLLAKAAKEVLDVNQARICRHIDAVNAEGRYTGIEAAFADPFDRHLAERYRINVDRKKSTIDIGSSNFFSRQGSIGKVDAVYGDAGNWSAAEYKAVRMPRRKGNPLFDISQISADGQRMRKATLLKNGWVVVFLYGPITADSPSGSSLLRDFLGQMFLETQNAMALGLMEANDANYIHTRLMGWNRAPGDACRPNGVGVKVGSLGAVIIECRGEPHCQ